MRILYLYDRMRAGGPNYLHAKRFVDFLRANAFVELRYAVVGDEFYDRFDRSDPGFPEIVRGADFLDGGYDVVVQSGPLLQGTALAVSTKRHWASTGEQAEPLCSCGMRLTSTSRWGPTYWSSPGRFSEGATTRS